MKIVFELHNGDSEPPVKSTSTSTEWIDTDTISPEDHSYDHTNEGTDTEHNGEENQNVEGLWVDLKEKAL